MSVPTTPSSPAAPKLVKLTPGKRVLFLTKDPELLRRQIFEGLDLRMEDLKPADLLDDINTDAMTPAWVCFDHLPREIAKNAYAGLIVNKARQIPEMALVNGNFEVIVSGARKGVGSSRETAAQCEVYSGIKIAIASSFAPIHARNNINLGSLMADHSVLVRLQRGESIPLEEFTREFDPITKLVVEHGGLFPFSKALAAGKVTLPKPATAPRAMNMTEKVLALHLVDASVKHVKPGDPVVVKVDAGYSHEFTTAQVHQFLIDEYGADYKLANPSRFAVFEDHLIYADEVTRMRPFMGKIETLRKLQREFQSQKGVLGFQAKDGVSPGICHQIAREHMIGPGDFVQATDSHTCMGGCNNSLAWGVGATEYAALAYAGFTIVEVPESIRFELKGKLRPNVTAKDVMLYILLHYAKKELTLNRVMEFGGPGLASLSMDERGTLTNMATECAARTGICEADEATIEWIAARRPGSDLAALRAACVAPDKGAHYDGGVHEIDLATIEPMVADPGNPDRGIPSDPTNGALVREIGAVKIDIAYGGSCTAGKEDDLDMYASVMKDALAAGRRVAPGVRFYIQFGSSDVERYARGRGYLDVFQKTGVTVIPPGCGACIGCGPGVSDTEDQVSVSAINRNYKGRSGPGKLWLASPLTVAASAVEGRIAAYEPGMFGKA
ncbi:MAG: aconitate hydratase [Planctomycetes bacterium]|nr:aconitate hydratase [Planctomycetota bacterium]